MRVRDGIGETKRPTDFLLDRLWARTDRLAGVIMTLSDRSEPRGHANAMELGTTPLASQSSGVVQRPTRCAAVNRGYGHSDREQIRPGCHRQIATRIGSTASLQRCRNLLARDRSTAAVTARKRITSILSLGRQIDALGKQITTTVTATRTPLLDIDGIGPFVAADIITEVGDPKRFTTKAKFAMANGTAPLEASSGRVRRYRLNRGGNRQLNKAIHIPAITQISRPDTEGRRYYDKRLADGKTKREAIRAPKRRISDRIWTTLTTAETPAVLT